MTEAEKERAAVVEWLRGEARAMMQHSWDDRLPLRNRANMQERARVVGMVREGIERGDHLKGTGDE